MSNLRVACIGAGYFSQFHYDAWARMDNVALVGSADRNLDAAKATGLPAFMDADQMLRDTSPDIVDIITPPPVHLAMIRAALAETPKAIICQKPFCASMDEAQEAIRLGKAAGIPIVVHENFRFQPWYREIKKVMNDNQIGDVLQVTFRLRPGDGQGPRAYLDRQPYFQDMKRFLVHETAVHWIDTFRYLLGEPDAVFADLRQMNPAISGEDAGYLMFAYPNGVRALFDGNRLLDHAAENTRCTMGEALIEGTKGTIALKGDGSVHLRAFGDQTAIPVLPASDHAGFGGDCVYALQAHVVDALLGRGALENTAEEYLPVINQEEAIYASAEAGCWIQVT